MRKLAPARVSYRHDFLISYRVYMMTGQPRSQGSLLPVPTERERQPRSQGSLLPVPTERERETLVGSGHVVPEQN